MPLSQTVKNAADWIAATITLATIVKLLPAIAALVSISWYAVQHYDRWKAKKA